MTLKHLFENNRARAEKMLAQQPAFFARPDCLRNAEYIVDRLLGQPCAAQAGALALIA